MFETYRMLGRQHEADLIHEAETLAQGAAVVSTSPTGGRRDRFEAVVTALTQLGLRRPGAHVPRGRGPA